MKLAEIVNEYYDPFLARYQDTVLPGQIKALNAIRSCRTADAGELYVRCPDCDHTQWHPLSCGHRNCPQCQNYEATQWIGSTAAQIAACTVFHGDIYIAL